MKKSIPYRVDQDSPDPKKKDPVPSFMDIQVGDERITKVNNRTVTDTTRGIKDGTSTYIDRQGNLRINNQNLNQNLQLPQLTILINLFDNLYRKRCNV